MLGNKFSAICSASWCVHLLKKRLIGLITLFSLLSSLTVFALETNVVLQDFYSKALLNNQKIKAYLVKSPGSYSYVASKTTNANGVAIFELDTSNGEKYVFKTNAYSSIASYSDVIDAQSNYQFLIGSLRLTLTDGNRADKPPLANHRFSVQRDEGDGKFSYYASGSTDENGYVRFDLENVLAQENGTKYRLYAKTAQTNSTKYSDIINQPGDITFNVGNLPLTLVVKDGLDQQAFADQKVEIYRVNSDSKYHWYSRATTNSKGQALFDLDPLPSGMSYVASSKMWNTSFRSSVLPVSGSADFLLGSTQIAIRNGSVSEQPVLPNKQVTIYQTDVNGNKQHYARITSDDNGIVRANLPGFESGSIYQIRAKSEVGNNYYYKELTSEGKHDFIVGSKPLLIKLSDARSDTPIINTSVTVYRISDDEKLHWHSRGTTDEFGKLSMDLIELQQGGRFKLSAKVFNNHSSYSSAIDKAGEYDFSIGADHFSFVDGTKADSARLTNTKVTFYRLVEGKKKWHSRITTDNQGVIRTDLDNLSKEQAFIASIKSPVSGQTKYTDPITEHGSKSFTIGNTPLVVTLKDAISQQVIPDNKLEVFRVDASGAKHWSGRYQSDLSGVVSLDLEELTENEHYILRTKYENSSFTSVAIPTSGEFLFLLGQTQVTLLSGTQTNQQGKLPLAEQYIHFYLKNDDGSSSWVNKLKTNEHGVVRLNLAGASDSKVYYAKAKSDIGDTWNNYDITRQGEHEFVVGTSPLNVSLVDAITGQAIPNQEVKLYQYDEEGKKHHKAKAYTNDVGEVVFDLAELEDGKPYVLLAKAYSGFTAQSALIKAAGDYQFKVGSVSATFVSGSDSSQSPIVNTRVDVYRVEDEKNHWTARATTNENGVIRVDLPELEEGLSHFFKIASPVNGAHKYTDRITTKGSYQFVVGNPAVSVRLSNMLTGTTYPDTSISAYRIDDEGKKHWVARQVTDTNSEAIFDLEGIADGIQYVLASKIFPTGYSYSEVVSAPSYVEFKVGALPITLVDRDSQQSISDKKVVVYEIGEDNRLYWRQQGKSSDEGQLTFDVEGLGKGKRFVLKSYNVFGNNQTYYGPVVAAPGEVMFTVKQGEGQSLDLVDPQITIVSPGSDFANANGFSLSGVADDDSGISKVEIELNDPVLGVQKLQAKLSNNSIGETLWSADIESDWLTTEQSINIKVTAYDYALNDAYSETTLLVKSDSEDPTIEITSHQNQQVVNNTGFTIEGLVSDDMAIASIIATLTDPILGTTIVDRQLLFNQQSGQWAMAVTNGKVSVGETVQLQFTVTDTSDKTAEISINLVAQEVEQNPLQLVNRITFGLTPDLLVRVKRGDDILEQQLTEQSLNDDGMEQLLTSLAIDSLDDLRQQQLYRMIHAEKQLREVMTWFWENHFSTNFNSHDNIAFEVAENNEFRQNALGNFTTLLLASAKSPAMLYYLNNAQNRVGRANENYAREVMELHTLGVDGGYDANDIAELSKIFTGWQERDGSFFFNEQDHDYSEKTVLGQVYSGIGLSEGEEVLTYLSLHSSTANYLCGKLVSFFVTERGNEGLTGQCAAEFIAMSGDIKSILRVIFNSQAFADEQVARDNIKTPVELILSIARNFSAQLNIEDTHDGVAQLGQSLFTYPVPTGYSEEASDWLNSNAILQRLKVVNEIVWQGDHGISLSLDDLLIAQGIDTPEAIVSYLADIAYGGLLTDLEFNTFIDILNQQDNFSFDASDASEKLNRLLATMISSPSYQMQ